MQIKLTAIIFNSPQDIELIPIQVDEVNYRLVLKKLQSERQKIIVYLKELKSTGQIKSIFRPKNKKNQETLDNLCKLKKDIKKNIEKIKTIYQ